jgi:hypothetical protein
LLWRIPVGKNGARLSVYTAQALVTGRYHSYPLRGGVGHFGTFASPDILGYFTAYSYLLANIATLVSITINMNNFTDLFKERMIAFWETSAEEEKKELLRDVLTYANSNPDRFKKEVKEIQFDNIITPLPIVLEALSKDTAVWGDFYVDMLNEILDKAEQIGKPADVLTFITEFCYIEDDTRPFVQKIVDRLTKAIDSENLQIQIKAISSLPDYLRNPSLKNRDAIINRLTGKLDDKNWKVRYIAFKYLRFEELLPPGRRLSFKDLILKTLLGEPDIF